MTINFSLRRKGVPAGRLAALVNLIVLVALALALFADAPAGHTQRSLGRATGYGISVGPHFPSRAGMLRDMGLNWVKVYDTGQIPDYNRDFRVLYRVDMRGYPEDIEGWERGLRDLAAQLHNLGVDAVEIGNEANLAGEWGGSKPNPQQFTDGLCRAYRAFKATAPDIIVVAGGLAPTVSTPDGMVVTDLDFAQQMFRYGARNCFDAWGYHPYGFNQPPEADPARFELVFRRTERMYRLLQNNGAGDRQIWITEFGWVRDPAEEGKDCGSDPGFANFNWMKFPASVQAAYTQRAFEFADKNWPWAGPMFLWNLDWNLYDVSYEPICSHLRWYGILGGDGAPLPVYYAVQNVEKLPEEQLRPKVGASTTSLTRTAEAGCASRIRMGSFTVENRGYPGPLRVRVEPANAPGTPRVSTSITEAASGTSVEIFVDASGIPPGLYLIAVNLRQVDTDRVTSEVVRGWLLIHYPTSPECIARYAAG
ncbi:MAG: hypothetical protein IT326_02525 [Anaerolineae bacterium]|nr:hypothetical protein [Anaerolineae bacterium]